MIGGPLGDIGGSPLGLDGGKKADDERESALRPFASRMDMGFGDEGIGGEGRGADDEREGDHESGSDEGSEDSMRSERSDKGNLFLLSAAP